MRRPLEAIALVLAVLASSCGPSPAYDIEEPATPRRPQRRPRAHRKNPAAAPGSLLGKWVGVGTQNNGMTWPMAVTITSLDGGVCAQVSYPAQRCGGEWRCQTSDGVTLRATEVLTYGHDECVDQGQLDMTLTAEGELVWAWTGNGMSASATLNRPAR